MNQLRSRLFFVAALLGMIALPLIQSTEVFAVKCQEVNVLGYPAWYNGLECIGTQPGLAKLGDVWVIVMNIIQWIIITAGYAAVVFIIIGGFTYITAQGDAAKISEAKKSITNAIIGLVIALAAVMIVRTIQAAIVRGSII